MAATWPFPKKGAESPSAQQRHSVLAVEHDKKGKSRWSRRDSSGRTGSTEYLTTSPEREGRAMSEVSSFHTQSAVSELQPSVNLSSTTCTYIEQRHPCFKWWLLTAGQISTLVTFLLLIVGIALVEKLGHQKDIAWHRARVACQVLRAAGLFGLTGGLANWIGTKLIFSGGRGIFCSGIITRHFVDARKCIANFMLEAFFNRHNIHLYVHETTRSFLTPEVFGEQLDKLLESETADRITDEQLQNLMSTPEGLKLQIMGVTKASLKPLVRSYLFQIKTEIIPLLLPTIQSLDLVNADKIREQVADLVATRTQELSAEQVRKIVKDTVYRHLTWLVFWGNVFGAVVGCAAELLSIQVRGLPT